MKENINEHDMTKKMMSIMRGGYKLLMENDGAIDGTIDGTIDDISETEDVISPKQGDSIFNSELKKLQDTVDPRVKITNFKIYPSDENVIIEGTFLQRESEDSGIKFKMSLSAGEIQTSMVDIELSDKVSLLLQKLKGYYENWVDEWALKLPKEYRPNQD
jgi:hypothetical protein